MLCQLKIISTVHIQRCLSKAFFGPHVKSLPCVDFDTAVYTLKNEY